MNKAQELLKVAVNRKMTVSVAESCTGGLLGARMTSVSGSSEYFLGGVIVYSNDAKARLLGVKKRTLEKFGAVSEQCAKEMALSVKKLLRSDFAIAITGIASPLGGTIEKPVGTVFIAAALRNEVVVKRFKFAGGRESIRTQSVEAALDMALKIIKRG